jgi:hypothetical protein
MSISNIPEQFDGEEDTDTVVLDMAAASEAAAMTAVAVAAAEAESEAEVTVSSPHTPPPSRVHLNAGTVRGVQSVPVGGSASSSRAKKHTNSGSPRSYLTANALKANDRALTVPTCSCNMCVTFAASTRLQRLAKYTEGQYGEAYARSSRVMSFLSTASTPGVSNAAPSAFYLQPFRSIPATNIFICSCLMLQFPSIFVFSPIFLTFVC